VDKINEIYLAVTSGLLAVGLWIFKRLFRSIDIAHERIDKLEAKQVDRAHLETQLAPIRQDLNIILQHLLGNKK
jgi:hypothetical protein|tara:strand:+ start:977 stop:1198 length:222 start_codon:yes stop_codon:yes gene_type:complete